MRERDIKSTLIINAKQAQKVNKQTKKKEEDAREIARSSRESPKSKKKSFQKGTSIRPCRYFFFSKINILFFVIKGRQHARTEYHPGGEEEEEARKIHTHRYYCSTIFFHLTVTRSRRFQISPPPRSYS